jgi:hypothetical protein
LVAVIDVVANVPVNVAVGLTVAESVRVYVAVDVAVSVAVRVAVTVPEPLDRVRDGDGVRDAVAVRVFGSGAGGAGVVTDGAGVVAARPSLWPEPPLWLEPLWWL